MPEWTKEKINRFLDSAHAIKLIATFKEADGYSLLIKDDSTNLKIRKLTCVPGFPTVVDSLIQTGIHEFKSKRFRASYLVNDSEVIATVHEKIIHPSSNWQGQTPWQDTIVTNYPRLDIRLK